MTQLAGMIISSKEWDFSRSADSNKMQDGVMRKTGRALRGDAARGLVASRLTFEDIHI
jgi:hypothetical protein